MAHYLFTQLYRLNRKSYIIEDPYNEAIYGPTLKGEQAEICCPIIFAKKIVGIIAVVAFNSEQRTLLLKKKKTILSFLHKMSSLLALFISERKVREHLVITNNQLKILSDSIQLCTVTVDIDCIVMDCSESVESVFGINKKALINKNFNHIWPNSILQPLLKTGKECINKEAFFDSPEGRVDFFVTAKPIFVNGQVRAALMIFNDIIERHNFNLNLNASQEQTGFDIIKGNSKKIKEIKRIAERVSKGCSNILITGESGTGKELFARAIKDTSSRYNKPFVIINCGAISETLLESELFGYVGGAFTGADRQGKVGKFELANGGTVFLDEIGEVPMNVQVKLLHVLQRREIERVGGNEIIPVDIRIIAATNKNLEEMCNAGKFRTDLYYRLNVIQLTIPPLRERKEDIEILMYHFLHKYRNLLYKKIYDFEDEVLRVFNTYNWPGNIRDLENAIEYSVNMELGKIIKMQSIPVRITDYYNKTHQYDNSSILDDQLKNLEKDVLLSYYQRIQKGELTRKEVSKLLGISRATLYRKLSRVLDN